MRLWATCTCYGDMLPVFTTHPHRWYRPTASRLAPVSRPCRRDRKFASRDGVECDARRSESTSTEHAAWYGVERRHVTAISITVHTLITLTQGHDT